MDGDGGFLFTFQIKASMELMATCSTAIKNLKPQPEMYFYCSIGRETQHCVTGDNQIERVQTFCKEVNEDHSVMYCLLQSGIYKYYARSDIQGNKTPLMFALADKHWSGTLRMVREYRFSSLRQ